jgi:hypothetical protein
MFFYPGPGNIPGTMYPSMAPHTALTVPSVQQPTRSIIYPEIECWFQYQDSNAPRNKDNIVFAPYGTALKSKGFRRINQLTPKFVSLADLQEWLGIDVGTAILIMQYVSDDVAALESGSWVFPQ